MCCRNEGRVCVCPQVSQMDQNSQSQSPTRGMSDPGIPFTNPDELNSRHNLQRIRTVPDEVSPITNSRRLQPNSTRSPCRDPSNRSTHRRPDLAQIPQRQSVDDHYCVPSSARETNPYIGEGHPIRLTDSPRRMDSGTRHTFQVPRLILCKINLVLRYPLDNRRSHWHGLQSRRPIIASRRRIKRHHLSSFGGQ